MGWLFGNSTNTSAGKRSRTKFRASGSNALGLPRSVGVGGARHLTVGHVAASHQGAPYIPKENPMPLCERLGLGMDSNGLSELDVGIELGIWDQQYKKAVMQIAMMELAGIEPEYTAEELADEKTEEEVEAYLNGEKWIPKKMLYQWFEMFD